LSVFVMFRGFVNKASI